MIAKSDGSFAAPVWVLQYIPYKISDTKYKVQNQSLLQHQIILRYQILLTGLFSFNISKQKSNVLSRLESNMRASIYSTTKLFLTELRSLL